MLLRQAVSTTRWRDVDTLLDMITELGGRLAAAQPKELAVGNIVRRVLKVIREVARGELETDAVDMEDFDESNDDNDDEYDNEYDDDIDDDNATLNSDRGKPTGAAGGFFQTDSSSPSQQQQQQQHQSRLPTSSNTSSNVGSVTGIERPSLGTQSSMFHLLSDASKLRNEGNNGSVTDQRQQKSIYNLKPLIIQEINEEIIAELESVYKGIADQAIDYIHAK